MSRETDMKRIDLYRDANHSIEVMQQASSLDSIRVARTHLNREIDAIREFDPGYANDLMNRAYAIYRDRQEAVSLMEACAYVREFGGADAEIAFLRARIEQWPMTVTVDGDRLCTSRQFFDENEGGLTAQDMVAVANLRPGETYRGGGGACPVWTVQRCTLLTAPMNV